jgi:hypothetical protein
MAAMIPRSPMPSRSVRFSTPFPLPSGAPSDISASARDTVFEVPCQDARSRASQGGSANTAETLHPVPRLLNQRTRNVRIWGFSPDTLDGNRCRSKKHRQKSDRRTGHPGFPTRDSKSHDRSAPCRDSRIFRCDLLAVFGHDHRSRSSPFARFAASDHRKSRIEPSFLLNLPGQPLRPVLRQDPGSNGGRIVLTHLEREAHCGLDMSYFHRGFRHWKSGAKTSSA